jgi:hypothetical protein
MENPKDNKNRDNLRASVALFAAGAMLAGAGVTMARSSHDAAPATDHKVVFGQSDLRVAGEVPEKVIFGQSDLQVAPSEKVVFGQSDLAVADTPVSPSPSTLVDVPHKVIFGQSDLHVAETPAPIKPHGIS